MASGDVNAVPPVVPKEGCAAPVTETVSINTNRLPGARPAAVAARSAKSWATDAFDMEADRAEAIPGSAAVGAKTLP